MMGPSWLVTADVDRVVYFLYLDHAKVMSVEVALGKDTDPLDDLRFCNCNKSPMSRLGDLVSCRMTPLGENCSIQSTCQFEIEGGLQKNCRDAKNYIEFPG